MIVRIAPLLAALPLLAACEGIQSALSPAGQDAGHILNLTYVLFAGGTLIFVVVAALLFWSLRPRPQGTERGDYHGLVVGGGLVFPVAALTLLVGYTAWTGVQVTRPAAPGGLRVEVIGQMWWWEIRYHLPDGQVVETANELYLPVGEPVELLLSSPDVIHSFWVPRLAGKTDLIPGRVNRMVVTAAEPAVMRGQCAEYCGAQHAWMAFYAVAVPPGEFEAWLHNQAAPAREPALPHLVAGRDAFVSAGCGGCHRVRGIAADGELGPDLTHVGGRMSIAGGLLGTTIGGFAGWIADAQGLKPGNRMPSFGHVLTGEELRAIAAYLDSLE